MTRDLAPSLVSTGAALPAGMTLPGGVGANAASPYQVVAAPGQTVLTVGTTGQEYQTVAAAVAASSNGDLILVQPGTYTNDFSDITKQVTIAGAGGMVDMVATVAPPSEKGIFVVDNNVQIDNMVFQGVAISVDNGANGAGIRYQGGAMVLHNDAFIGNQNGILAAAVDGLAVNTISIQGSTFDNNGNSTGPAAGYTHNCYISTGITSLTATGNIFERANIGHELKSRAATNLISGNVFYDGPAGTASYSIDLPNGGADTVSGNIIEKGPHVQNYAIVHFGGEGIPYAGSSLLVTGNHFMNDLGPQAIGVLNQTTLQVSVTGNQFDNFEKATLASGAFVQSGNIDEHGNAIASSSSVTFSAGTNVDDFSHDSLAHNVVLTTATGVLGGGGLLTVTANAGHVTVLGGAGGLNYQEETNGGGSYITTATNASDTVSVHGQDTIASGGHDNILIGSGNSVVQVGGTATISSGAGSNAYAINGQASIQGGGGSDTVQINAAVSSAFVTGAEGYLQAADNGGVIGFNITEGGVAEQATISGGGSTTRVYGSTMNVTTAGAGAGSVVVFGAGTGTIVSLGADTIHAGSGTSTVIVSASSQVYGGTGTLSVYGKSESGQASVFGAGGSILISGDTGNITYFGGPAANTVNAALSSITLQGNAGLMNVIGGSRQTIMGGSGGIAFATQGGADIITTAAGAHDTVSFAQACTLVSNGTDIIAAGAGNSTITANGSATITGSTGAAFYTLNGTDSLAANGYTRATVGVNSHDTVTAYGVLTTVVMSAGGTLAFAQMGNADLEAATVSGAGASLVSYAASALTSIALNNAGSSAMLGAGHDSVGVNTGGATIWTGTGADTVNLQRGGNVVHAGSGTTAVIMSDGSDQAVTTIFGGSGALTAGQGYGNLSVVGGQGTAVLGMMFGHETIIAGAGNMTLTGGSAGTNFTAGTGSAAVTMTTGGGIVTFGSGATSVVEAGWGAANVFDFNTGHGGGSDTITNFRAGVDSLVFNGVTVTSNVSHAGSTQLTLSDGTHLSLVGVAAFAMAH